MTSGEGPADPRFPEEQPEVFPRPFGNYLLLARLAQGGMGEVYLAKSGGVAGIEKHSVVKTLRPHFTADREYVTRFIDEARVVVGLNHRNIAPTFDVGRVGGQYYLAMEFIPGRDLRNIDDVWRAQRGRPMDEAVALHVICEVLEALDYAHRAKDPVSGKPLQLIHRDISPQNVMISLEGEVKLIDFGLAQSTQKEEHTQPHVVMGKMAYMAPEQARGEGIDSSVDLFAVAIMAYELVLGERYYGDMTLEQIWSVAGRGDYEAPRFDELNPRLQNILDRALHAEKEHRHLSCGDLREDLLNYTSDLGMRAGSRDLRMAMEELFGEDADQHRAIIQQYADVQLVPQGQPPPMTDSGGHPVAGYYPAQDESVSFLASNTNPGFQLPTSGPILASGGRPLAPGGRGEGTGETARILRAPAQLTGGKMVAAMVAVFGALIVGGLALGLVLGGEDPDEQTAVISAVPADDWDVDPKDNPAAKGDGGVAEASEDAGAPTAPDPTPTVEDKPKDPKPTTRRTRRTRRTRGGSPGRLPDALRNKPLKRPVDKINFLRDHCTARVACARTVTNAVKKSPEELVKMIKSGKIDQCLRACRR
jgi:serine/threonine protein kinase